MKQGISIVKKEGPGFENYSLNFEAALFLGSLFKSMWQWFLSTRSSRFATSFQCEVYFIRDFCKGIGGA